MTTVAPDGHLWFNGEIYGPHFADGQDAREFVDAVIARTGLDPRQQSDDWLEKMAAEFVDGKELV